MVTSLRTAAWISIRTSVTSLVLYSFTWGYERAAAIVTVRKKWERKADPFNDRRNEFKDERIGELSDL